MRYIGILLLVNTVCVSGYFFFATTTDAKRVSVFAVVSGVLALMLIIGDRVTNVKLSGVGEIAAATEKAEASADRILKIEREVETHRDTIAMVAREANATHKQLEFISETIDRLKKQLIDIDQLQKEASESLEKLTALSDFYNYMMRARSDDRKSFDRVVVIANDKTDFRQSQAIDFLGGLPKEVEILNLLDYKIDWHSLQLDPSSASLDDIKVAFSKVEPIYQSEILNTVWTTDRFSKKDRIQFLIDVITNTRSMRCLDKSTRILGKESQLGKNFLMWHLYLEWWKAAQAKY